MIMYGNQPKDVVLYQAGSSLVTAVGDWLLEHPDISLRLVHSTCRSVINGPLGSAAVAIVDATDKPGAAAATLERLLKRIAPSRIAVYTERTHAGLEVFVRVRGPILLLGPMGADDWDACLSALAHVPARSRNRRQTG